jgi:hypothetical protein
MVLVIEVEVLVQVERIFSGHPEAAQQAENVQGQENFVERTAIMTASD